MSLVRASKWLLLFALITVLVLLSASDPAYAAQSITIEPTQPVYLVDNGDTAQVGFRMTFTGDPLDGLDRDITLALTTGTALQVGSSPGNAQNVTTELAGAKTAIAAGSSTLAQGKGFLWGSFPAGSTNIRVNNVTNIFVGQSLNIDTGPNLETVTVTEVGTAGSNGTGITFTPPLTLNHSFFRVYSGVTPAGSTTIRVVDLTGFAAGQTIDIDSGANLETVAVAEVGKGGAALLAAEATAGSTNIKVDNVANLVAGNKLWIGMGASQESAVIAAVGSEGEGGTGVTLTAALANDHVVGEPVTGNIVVLTAPLALSHAGTSFFGPDIPVVGVTPPGATNIKVQSVDGFVSGQDINIDTGANLELATIANVGTAGVDGTGLDLVAPLVNSHSGAVVVVQADPVAFPGATNIKVDSVMGFYPGDLVRIDSGASAETHTIVTVGTAGLYGTGIDLANPLLYEHQASAGVTDTRVLQSTAVDGVDYAVPDNMVVIPAGSPSGTEVTIPIETMANPNPSLALTINTTAACVDGCAGVTVNNNDPSTVVINAHGFPYLDSTLSIDERVDDLLSRMSLFEKVGQMTQTNMNVLNSTQTTSDTSINNVRAWRLGSILSGGSDNPNPNSPTGWADLVDGFQYRALATPLQIPYIYGEDTIHGNAHMVGAVMFPHNIGIGATRDPELSYLQGVITAQETRSAGPHWGFGPAVCVARDIRWGRTYECFSEVPELVSLMETMLEGYQGTDPEDLTGMKLLSTPKHFAGDGATQNGQNTGNVVMSSEEFEYVALSPYVPAVQQYHAATIMPSYSSTQLDGAPSSILMSANEELMTGWLKDEIGFEGFLISDWNAINSIPVPNPNPLPPPIDQSYAYNILVSFNAGMDMVMSPNQPAWKNFINYLQTLVDLDYVSQERIDDAVSRILRQKFALGLFGEPFTDRSTQDQIYSPEHRAVARQATAESQVLLKNEDNILPLSKTANIYLAGRNADNIINQAGGWSISWQSIPGNMVPEVAPYFTTIRQALENVVGAGNVTFSETASPEPEAGVYDVGIVVVGENAYAEGSGDVPGAQSNMTTAADATAINRVCGVMPCVVMTVSGRPFMLTDDQFDQAQAVVGSWLPGSEGDGIGDVLFGDMDFAGRLSMTWPWTNNQEPINVGDADYDPRYPYGWGLRTGSSRAGLQDTRDSLATIAGDPYVDAAVAYLDQLLGADVWDVDGAVTDAGYALRLLYLAAEQLAMTDAESFNQTDGVYGAALDIAQASVVADGGPTAITSPLIANADYELLVDHPDVAIELLAQAVAPVVSADPAMQTVQYTDYVETVTINAGNAASELPLLASTEWSQDGGAFQPGLPTWLTWSELGCTADGIWGDCAWTLAGVDTVPVPAGTYVVRTTVTEGEQSSSIDVTLEVAQEDAAMAYTGEGIKEVGESLALRVTVWDSAANGYAGPNPEFPPTATIGDITKMWISFELSDCVSGAPLMSQVVQVVDSGDLGDGIGTADTSYTSDEESFICVSMSLVGEGGGLNEWYAAESADTVLIFYYPSEQFATGGGWIADPDGGKGTFGVTARYLKNGRVQGNLVYIFRGMYNGEMAEFKIKGNSLNALAFDGSGESTSAIVQGKATLSIYRASDGEELWSDGNATFQATLVDGDADTFALTVYDKRGVLFKSVPTTPLSGGNIVAHR